MAVEESREAATRLAEQAREIGRAPGRVAVGEFLRRVSQAWFDELHDRPSLAPEWGTSWQDADSPVRPGWRERAALVDGEAVFAVDYQVCRQCQLGWVEEPYTEPGYQRCGLATAGLAAIRADIPGVAWHTLGGHFGDSEPFWDAVGAAVAGGYRQLPLCRHITRS